MSKRIGLGKGLGAFFGEDYEIEPQKERSVVKEKATVKKTQNQGKDEKKEKEVNKLKKDNRDNDKVEKIDINTKEVIEKQNNKKTNDIEIRKDSLELKNDVKRHNIAGKTNDTILVKNKNDDFNIRKNRNENKEKVEDVIKKEISINVNTKEDVLSNENLKIENAIKENIENKKSETTILGSTSSETTSDENIKKQNKRDEHIESKESIGKKKQTLDEIEINNDKEMQEAISGGKEVNSKTEPESKEKIKIVEVEKEKYLNISLIEPNRSQPRKMFDEEQLNELADSVREYGVLQPLLVQKKGEYYEIIAGERRWRAAKIAGLKEVPVVVREYSKQRTMEIALIENVQRADLNPIEEAKAYQILVQEFGLKQEEVATRVSKNRATITNSMRLLKLDERIQNMLIQNKISGGHARSLLALEDKEQQYLVASKIIENQLSVREVEKLVKKLSTPVDEKKKKSKEDNEKERDLSVFYHDLEDKLKMVMGTKVTINKKDKNKGRIEIEYYSPEELERIIELLQSINN